MKMKFKVSGVGRVSAQLRQIGERSSDKARGRMKRAADRIVLRAKLYVPEDEGALKESIRIEKTYEGRGRLAVEVVAGNAEAILANGKLINVDQYAWIIHERYASMKPGKNTRAKMEANPGVEIGQGFMTRAYEEEVEKLEEVLTEVITQIIKESGL